MDGAIRFLDCGNSCAALCIADIRLDALCSAARRRLSRSNRKSCALCLGLPSHQILTSIFHQMRSSGCHTIMGGAFSGGHATPFACSQCVSGSSAFDGVELRIAQFLRKNMLQVRYVASSVAMQAEQVRLLGRPIHSVGAAAAFVRLLSSAWVEVRRRYRALDRHQWSIWRCRPRLVTWIQRHLPEGPHGADGDLEPEGRCQESSRWDVGDVFLAQV